MSQPGDRSPLDKMFDGMEAVVGGLERSKALSDPLPNEDIEDAEYTDYRNPERSDNIEEKKDLLWGLDKEALAFHIFEGFGKTSLCNRHFDASQLSSRRTEMEDGFYKCCGGCLRSLHNKYKND